MKRLTLVPAYGRDYKSKKALLEDFHADKDFILADLFHGGGTYTNKSDLIREGIKRVSIRYGNLRKVAVIDVK